MDALWGGYIKFTFARLQYILDLRSFVRNFQMRFSRSFVCNSDALWGKYILGLRSFAIFNLVCNAFYIVILILTSRLCMNTKGGGFYLLRMVFVRFYLSLFRCYFTLVLYGNQK